VRHLLISGVIIGITGLNLLSADLIGRAENWIVIFKLIILGLFVIVGIQGIDVQNLQPSTWASPTAIVAGGMIIFLAYEGFELIANTAEDVKQPQRTLPYAYYSAVIFVILLYISIAVITTGSLPTQQIVSAKEYALAAAAKPFMGKLGFSLIAFAALLSTASAINATLYGASRLSYIIAKSGELPAALERKIWNQPIEGLLITSGLTLVIANVFDLSGISTMGSSGFLLIFAVVNFANFKLYRKTHGYRWVSLLATTASLAALVILLTQTAHTNSKNLWIVIVMVGMAFTIELIYKRFKNRHIHLNHQ
jgi:amino acid transporter